MAIQSLINVEWRPNMIIWLCWMKQPVLFWKHLIEYWKKEDWIDGLR